MRSELAVAREAIVLAQDAAERLGANDRSAHVGYYLIDHGRQALERSTGCRLSWKMRISRASRHFRLFLYLGPMMLLTALATSVMLSSFGAPGPGDWRYWFFAVTGIIAISALAVPVVR